MRKSICIVVSSPITLRVFLLEQIRELKLKYHVDCIANTDDSNYLRRYGVDVDTAEVCVERGVSIRKDLCALRRLYRIFKKERYDLIHTVTPKAGLLGMLAGWMAGVPLRVHTYTGQVWAVKRGIKRWVLKCADRVIGFAATDILADSRSQKEFIVNESVVSRDKCRVLADGSIAGVNANKFKPDQDARREIRSKLSLDDDNVAFLYIGRLHEDKGLCELAAAFLKVNRRYANVRLIVVGPDEGSIKGKMSEICSSCAEKIAFVHYTDSPESYMAASDVLCLPSYREGFGSVIVEAACVGIPAIATNVYGVSDAIEEDKSGLMHNPRDVDALAEKMCQMIVDPAKRDEMGAYARRRALTMFSMERLNSELLSFYGELFGEIEGGL